MYNEIKHIYPGIKDSEFSLQDDGDGIYIKEWTYSQPQPTVEQIEEVRPVILKRQLVTQIDDAVASIYLRFTRFESEYELRESQAQAYKNAGYTGTTPEQVMAFANPAGMDYESATNLILNQAAQLRTALAQLGVQRMRKYEILNAATAAAVHAKYTEISAAIKAIGDSLA